MSSPPMCHHQCVTTMSQHVTTNESPQCHMWSPTYLHKVSPWWWHVVTPPMCHHNASWEGVTTTCHHNMSPQHVTTSATTMCTTTSHHKMSPHHVTTVCRNKVSPRMCHHNVSPQMCPHNASPVACRRGRSSAVSATLSTPGRRPSHSAEWTWSPPGGPAGWRPSPVCSSPLPTHNAQRQQAQRCSHDNAIRKMVVLFFLDIVKHNCKVKKKKLLDWKINHG